MMQASIDEDCAHSLVQAMCTVALFGELPKRSSFGWTSHSLAALLVYEYMVTFDREVATYWRRQYNWASVIFFLNRYLIFIPYLMRISAMRVVNVEVGRPSPSVTRYSVLTDFVLQRWAVPVRADRLLILSMQLRGDESIVPILQRLVHCGLCE